VVEGEVVDHGSPPQLIPLSGKRAI